MYAPLLFQSKYLDVVWKIPDEKFGYMNLVTVFSIFAALFWSGIADRFGKHRQLLILKTVLYAASYFTMWVLEQFMGSWSFNHKVGVITFLFFTTTVFCSAIYPLLGALVFSILESSPSLKTSTVPPKRLLGRQRLFGTIGASMVYSMNGWLKDRLGFKAQFFIVSISAALFVLVAYLFLDDEVASNVVNLKEKKKVTEKTDNLAKAGFWNNLGVLLGKTDVLVLLVIVFLIGAISSVFNIYMTNFMSLILKGIKYQGTLLGFMNSVRLLIDLPMYVFGDKLLAWLGPFGVLLIGMLASTLRPLGYALAIKDETSSNWAFVFELFKGVSHATNTVGGCILASDLAPPHAQSTAQALFTSAHHHAASVISGLFCSFYLDARKGPNSSDAEQIEVYRSLFMIVAVIGCLGCFLNITRIIIGRQRVTIKR